jgi:hypothetical protein
VIRLTALILALPLLGVAAVPSAFSHRFSVGESIHYKYSYNITAQSTRDAFGGEFRLDVKSADPVVSGTEFRTRTPPAQHITRDFVLQPDGSLVFPRGSEPTHNYVTYDTHQYCPLPATVATGASWSCKVPSVGFFHGGDTTVRVTSMDEHNAVLELSGSGADEPKTERDPDNGHAYVSRATTTYKETVQFKDGLVSSIVRDQNTRTVMENLTLEARVRVRIDRV